MIQVVYLNLLPSGGGLGSGYVDRINNRFSINSRLGPRQVTIEVRRIHFNAHELMRHSEFSLVCKLDWGMAGKLNGVSECGN